MSIFPWIGEKKKFFSEIIVSKMTGKESILNENIQVNTNPTQNKHSIKLITWNDLLIASSNLNPSIVRASNTYIFCGFDVSEELGQRILDKAFMKVYEDFYNALDQDEETVRSLIIDYIFQNKFQEKGLHILIKKLKNLDLEDLPDLL